MKMTEKERRALIARLGNLPTQVEQAIDLLPPAQLDMPYRAGGWTPRQVVHHLVDSHINAYVRMKLIATEDTPTLKPYDQEAWANAADYKMPIKVSIGILIGLHARWATWLESIATDTDVWRRAGMHPDDGRLTLDDLLTRYVAHGDKHVGHIRHRSQKSELSG
ncbi:MAG: putative metal-dependent hydrolase [Pyrinomonadaceae bacterium MAG19_C2-C3]|nr:putative metal-dependent hydrolase [Pyrinomonadaceae bacterium MAG19_C2-C3]